MVRRPARSSAICRSNSRVTRPFDAYWEERDISAALREVDMPVYSIGVWSKLDLHLNGNILGYQAVRGPKKLRLSGAATAAFAHKEFAVARIPSSDVLLPFYDHYLKGEATAYPQRPRVEYFVRGRGAVASATAGRRPAPRIQRLYLNAETSGSVTSLNDGSLAAEPPRRGERIRPPTATLIPTGPSDMSHSVRTARPGRPRPDLYVGAA